MKHWVYILHSVKLDRFYIGASADVAQRLLFHQNSEARKFTANAKDWELFHEFACDSKQQALAIESHIKRMKSSVYIQNLKKYPEIVEKLRKRYVD